MSELKPFLNRLYRTYHSVNYLETDPLGFVHQFNDPWDQEAVGLLAALLAYGNVKQIRASVQGALDRIKECSQRPSQWVRGLGTSQAIRKAYSTFEGFSHRFHLGSDVVVLFRLLEGSWRQKGSLGAHLTQDLESQDRDFGHALSNLIRDWKATAREMTGERGPHFEHLLNSPKDGSVCKRWSMLLRWMGRKDDLDLGLWNPQGALGRTFLKNRGLLPEQLVIPLDTHTGRISQYLGLTSRKSLNWKAALEITECLRSCDSKDPVKYDFALSRLGILDLCQKRFDVEICRKCDLVPVCQYAKGRSKSLLMPEWSEKSRMGSRPTSRI